ncbi:MAG: lysine biosynthesis protein LysW [Acidobacteriota bacterium]
MLAACMECEAEFIAEEPATGEILSCPECGLDMQVISTKPLELEPVAEDAEDTEIEDG